MQQIIAERRRSVPPANAPYARPQPPFGLVRTLLAVLFVGGMIAACLWILYPFLSAVVWATLLVVSTWSPMLAMQRWLWGSRKLAVAVMTTLALIVFLVPLALAAAAIVRNMDEVVARVESLQGLSLPPPPAWVRDLPLIGGGEAVQDWQELATLSPDELRARVQPYGRSVARWVLQQAGSFTVFLVHLALTLVIAAALYLHGEAAARGVGAFARRLAGPRGEDMALLSMQAIRAVALGVIVTAAVEALLAAAGLVVAGVPFPAFVTALVFVAAVAQAPMLVLLPVIVWLYWKGGSALVATAFLAWSLVIATVDNVARPIVIKKSAHLPLALIFAGVVGGLIAFGAMGLFIGPVVLAVAYTLLAGWVNEGPESLIP